MKIMTKDTIILGLGKDCEMRTKPTLDECRAYIVLKDVLNIKCLELSDKPDLVDMSESIGIEVVNAIPNDVLHVANMYDKKENHYINLEAINKAICKYGYSQEYLANDSFNPRTITKDEIYQLLNERIKEKCCKKCNYKEFREYRLFLNTFTGKPYDSNDFTDYVSSLYKEYKHIFNVLYFFIMDLHKVITIDENGITEIEIEDFKEIEDKAKSLRNSRKSAST